MLNATFSNETFLNEVNDFVNSTECRKAVAQDIMEGLNTYKDKLSLSTLKTVQKELNSYTSGNISLDELNKRMVVLFAEVDPAKQTKTSFWAKAKTVAKWGAGVAAIGGIGYLIYNRVKSGDVEGLAEQTAEAANAAASFFQ